MKKQIALLFTTIIMVFAFAACGAKTNAAVAAAEETAFPLEQGVYLVNFDTDSSMFHVNEVMQGKATLTVDEDGATVHLVMPSKNVLHLYLGLAEDAKNDEVNWIDPTVETVTYEDGLSEEVFAYDIAVSVIDEEFDLALIGKKDVWYDHKVSVSNAQPAEKTMEVTLEGGTGKVTLASPTKVTLLPNGYLVDFTWSSKNYDYMIVDGVRYEPISREENSYYQILIKDISEPLAVIADTVAMSTPHEIEYTVTFVE